MPDTKHAFHRFRALRKLSPIRTIFCHENVFSARVLCPAFVLGYCVSAPLRALVLVVTHFLVYFIPTT